MTWKRVAPGDDLEISDRWFNAVCDVLEWFERGTKRTAAAGGASQSPNTIALIRNDSGADVDRGGCLAITGVVITPDDNLDAFASQPCLIGNTPSGGADPQSQPLAVPIEPIAAGAIGRAVVSGLAMATVNIQATTDCFADMEVGSTAELASGPAGRARIIYKPAGTGVKTCLVSMGDGFSAGKSLPSNAHKAKYQVLQLSDYNATDDDDPDLWTIDYVRWSS